MQCVFVGLNICLSVLLLGMPDDCTVIVGHIVGRSADDQMDMDHQ